MSKIDWLKAQVLAGLQGLLALRLDNAPALDSIEATAAVWVRVLETRPITWDEDADKRRVAEAFRELAAVCQRWPSPAKFLEVLPARKPTLALDYAKPQHTPESRAAVDKLRAMLRMRDAA